MFVRRTGGIFSKRAIGGVFSPKLRNMEPAPSTEPVTIPMVISQNLKPKIFQNLLSGLLKEDPTNRPKFILSDGENLEQAKETAKCLYSLVLPENQHKVSFFFRDCRKINPINYKEIS